MADFQIQHLAFIAVALGLGLLLGWIVRGKRAEREKLQLLDDCQEQLDAISEERDSLTEQNRSLMQQVSQLQAANEDVRRRTVEFSDALKAANDKLQTAEAERVRLTRELAGKIGEEAQIEARDSRIEWLEAELGKWQQRVPPLVERFRQCDAELMEAKNRIHELQTLIELGQTRVEPLGNPERITDGHDASNEPLQSAVNGHVINGAADNLQQIRGIGPAIEKTLHELGIYRLRQIAEMSDYDINRVADHLRGFHSRIYREDWIGQARELCKPTHAE